jgi:hypothetical protein
MAAMPQAVWLDIRIGPSPSVKQAGVVGCWMVSYLNPSHLAIGLPRAGASSFPLG